MKLYSLSSISMNEIPLKSCHLSKIPSLLPNYHHQHQQQQRQCQQSPPHPHLTFIRQRRRGLRQSQPGLPKRKRK
ncbi:hypothetical protein FKM82_022804 [Ascaphus truei]